MNIQRRPRLRNGAEDWSYMTKNAYDIRCRDAAFQKQMEEDFQVKMTQEDIVF